ncbi:MAG: type II 3-dehydroquinate dehydratase [Burkholderiaceae bacterium]
MSARILVIHGAGMNMRGKAQVEIFGPMTLADYDRQIRASAGALGASVDIFHSNIEGEVINRLYEAHEQGGYLGAIINPAGFMAGYPALCAAIDQVSFPVWELHLSNPARRGRTSEVAGVVRGVVTGFGIHGYELALRGILAVAADAAR